MAADVRIRWLLELTDRATRPMLASDRNIRRNVEQTARVQQRAALQAQQAAQRTATALAREATATGRVSREVSAKAREQARALALGARLVEQSRRLERAYNSEARAADRARRSHQGLFATMRGRAGGGLTGGIGLGVGGATAGAAAGGFLAGRAISTGINFNRQVERSTVAFSTLLGSASRARREIVALQQLAKDSALFSFEGLVKADQRLVAFGIQADKAREILAAMGDAVVAAGGTADQIDQISLALGQMASKGKVSAEELLQLTEAGIPATQILKRELGLTGDQVANIGKQGIPASQAIDALARGIRKDFGGAARDAATTFDAQWARLQDSTQQTFGAMTRPVFQWLERAVLPAANRAATELTRIWQRPGVTPEQRFDESMRSIDRNLGPVAQQIQRALAHANIGDKLSAAFDAAVPKIADSAVNAAPKVAAAFVNAWLHAGVWTKLVTAGFLATRLGVFSWAGGRAADLMVDAIKRRLGGGGLRGVLRGAGRSGGIAAGGAAAEGMADELPGALGKRRGRLVGTMRTVFRSVGVAAGVAAGAAIAAEIEKRIASLIPGQPSGGGRAGTADRTIEDQVAPGRGAVRDALGWLGRKLGFQGGGMVPGQRTPADSVLAALSPGEAVLTGHGQQLVEQIAGPGAMDWVIQHQMPHFQAGGVVSPKQIAGLARGAGFSGGNLNTSVAVALAESGGNAAAFNRNSDGSVDRGLWQINSVHGPLSTFDPQRNAKAAWQISSHGRNWRPWVTYNTGAYRRFLDRARAGARGVGDVPGVAIAGDQTISLPRRYGKSQIRGGLIDDAFGIGEQAALAGRQPPKAQLLSQLAEAYGPFTRQVTLPGSSRGITIDDQLIPGTGQIHGSGLTAFNALARRFGLTIGSGVRRGSVTVSGNRSWHALGRARDFPGPPANMLRFARYLAAHYGPRLKELIHTPLGFGIKNGRHVPLSFWGGAVNRMHGNHVHVAMRRGGRIPGFRRGGTVTDLDRLQGGLSRAMSWRGGTLAALDSIIEGAAATRLYQFRQELVHRIQRGGTVKIVQRLQSALSLVDAEFGYRVGQNMAAVQRSGVAIDRMRGRVDRRLRASGIDQSSPEGLAQLLGAEQFGARELNVQRTLIRKAINNAARAKQQDRVNELKQQLAETQDAIAESAVRQIEIQRDIVQAQAERARQQQIAVVEEALAQRSYEVDIAQAVQSATESGMRLSRAPSMAVAASRSAFVSGQLIPLLQGQQAAVQSRASLAISQQDWDTARSATLQLWQITQQITDALADAADGMRDAAMALQEENVAQYRFSSSTADIMLRRLELEQRLAGTYDSGGSERASFIRATVIPRIQAEVTALSAQRDEALRQNNQELARQIALEMWGRQNDVLQAQLDAQEQTAQNTEALREFGGSLGFAYGGQQFTDLIALGTGA